MTNTTFWPVILFITVLAGCEPIALPDPPTDFDRLASVYALVSPDSVLVYEKFHVQIGYGMVCGGELKEFRVEKSTDRIMYSPVLHITPTSGCGDSVTYQTLTDSTSFSTAGRRFILSSGNQGVMSKPLEVVTVMSYENPYRMKFSFVDAEGVAASRYTAQLQFPDRAPGRSFTIVADSAGRWDTSFIDTAVSLRYILAGVPLRAKRFMKEVGIIAILN